MNYFIQNTRSLDGGWSFRVVAELSGGRRFEHFLVEPSATNRTPAVMSRLVARIRAVRPDPATGRNYWRETHPNPRSPAGREFAADMARIESAEEERDAERENDLNMIMREAELGDAAFV